MRISDWSSDVCSSDLPRDTHLRERAASGPCGLRNANIADLDGRREREELGTVDRSDRHSGAVTRAEPVLDHDFARPPGNGTDQDDEAEREPAENTRATADAEIGRPARREERRVGKEGGRP